MAYNKKKNYMIIARLAFANTAVYGIPCMKMQFYDIMLSAWGYSHTQLSGLYSIYGIVCMGAYLAGGFLADAFPAKKIMITALIASGILHFLTLTQPSYFVLSIIFALLGITSVMAFYPASMKILSCMQNEKESNGIVFGIYVAIVNIVNICIAIYGIYVLNNFKENVVVFRSMIIVYGVMHFGAALLILVLFKNQAEDDEKNSIEFKELPQLICNKNLWLVVVIVFCNYLLQSTMVYVIPYFSNIYHMSESAVLIFSILRVNITTIIIAPFSGKITDIWNSATKLIKYTFVVAGILMFAIIGSLCTEMPVGVLMLLVLGVNAICIAGKTVNLVTINEIGISKEIRGTAIGLVSFLGYSSDAFYYSYAGSCLDHYQTTGYFIIFMTFVVCCAIGYFACSKLEKLMKKSFL